MKYTKNKPTEMGFYWVRTEYGEFMSEICRFADDTIRVLFMGCDYTEYELLDKLVDEGGYEWAGPIPKAD